MIGILGIVVSLGLLIFLAYRGWNVIMSPRLFRLLRCRCVSVLQTTNIGVPAKQNSYPSCSGSIGISSGHGSGSNSCRSCKTRQNVSSHSSRSRSSVPPKKATSET